HIQRSNFTFHASTIPPFLTYSNKSKGGSIPGHHSFLTPFPRSYAQDKTSVLGCSAYAAAPIDGKPFFVALGGALYFCVCSHHIKPASLYVSKSISIKNPVFLKHRA